jgi:hypothetical protein
MLADGRRLVLYFVVGTRRRGMLPISGTIHFGNITLPNGKDVYIWIFVSTARETQKTAINNAERRVIYEKKFRLK